MRRYTDEEQALFFGITAAAAAVGWALALGFLFNGDVIPASVVTVGATICTTVAWEYFG